jgi:hypothetical protein
VNLAYLIVQFLLALTIVVFALLILFAVTSRRGRR